MPYLRSCDEQETSRQEKTLQRGLRVAELHTINVQNALAIGRYERVKSKDFKHLECGDERTSPLLDDLTDAVD